VLGVLHILCGNSQGIRFIGGLSVYVPFTSSSSVVSNFALCGMPFLAGFYSKDFILEMFSMRYVNMVHCTLAPILWEAGFYPEAVWNH
jgi:NADH:ubiquinone oxidoreductase subunit 5 (subunit L)/multisubunit Na+/H+ antiporter MnhA subunit